MLALRPVVPSRWDWFRLSSFLPRTYVRGYPMPSLRDWSIAVPSAAEAGFLFVALCGTAEAVPFPSKVRSRVKIRVKGDGQECPSHTCH
jgi:hypothetical protein